LVRQGRGVSGRQPNIVIGKGNALTADPTEKGVAFRDKLSSDSRR